MFRIISPNPLLDVIYQSEKEFLGNRIFFETTRFKAGGFGPNTARALACLGERVECHMISGGVTGRLVRKELVENGIRVVSRRGESSRVSAIWVSGQHSRMLVSPSPNVSARALHRLFDRFQEVTTPANLTQIIRRYTDNRAIVALVSLMMLLEIVLVLRIIKPDYFKSIVENHVFELVVLLALAQMILLLSRLLDRAPGRVCRDEHECEVLLRAMVKDDARIRTLHVFSCGLGSRLEMITSIHNESRRRISTEVLAQAPDHAVDKEDADRTRSILKILKRDHSDVPVEVRLFETPATIRALILCADKRKPLWGVVSWYKYEKSNGLGKVIGRSNPAIVLKGYESAEDQIVLNFLMDTFEHQWPRATRFTLN